MAESFQRGSPSPAPGPGLQLSAPQLLLLLFSCDSAATTKELWPIPHSKLVQGPVVDAPVGQRAAFEI
jgi:hypothetical protein